MSTTSYLRGNSAFFDFSAAMASIGFLTINVLEVLLVVNAVDQSESICRKVVKRVHIINYWQRHFDNRLKQSVSAEGLLTSDQSDWIFFTCSWSYFLISQQGISSKLWWCGWGNWTLAWFWEYLMLCLVIWSSWSSLIWPARGILDIHVRIEIRVQEPL